jgi:hypothetical protein
MIILLLVPFIALGALLWFLNGSHTAQPTTLGQVTASANIAPAGPSQADLFIAWCKEDWMLKIGALLLLIGFGWFVSYAFTQGWVSPMGQVLIGVIAGSLLMVLGLWRSHVSRTQGSIFLVLGAAIAQVSIFAATASFGFIHEAVALPLIFIYNAFVALYAVKEKSATLAMLSVLAAAFAPMFTLVDISEAPFILPYIAALSVSAVWLDWKFNRALFTLVSILFSYVYASEFQVTFFNKSPHESYAFMFALALALFFSIVTIVRLIRTDVVGRQLGAHITIAFISLMWSLNWITNSAGKLDYVYALLFAAIYACMAAVAHMHGARKAFFAASSLALVMLTAAIIYKFEGTVLTVALTLEALLVTITSYYTLKKIDITERISAIMIVPVLAVLPSLDSSSWNTGVMHSDFLALLAVTVSLFGIGELLLRVRYGMFMARAKFMWAVHMLVGSLFAYALVWLVAHALWRPDLATMASLAVYTVVGIVCYFYGHNKHVRELTLYGAILVGVVIGRLLLVDVWEMVVVGRIITFMVIGALLVATAFISKKKNPPTSTSAVPPTPAV